MALWGIDKHSIATPVLTVGEDPPEVKRYREDFEKDRLPRPSCLSSQCRVQRWTLRWRRRVLDEDGRPLRPVPIRRYRCAKHGEVTPLPECLAPCCHYLAHVIQQSLEEYAASDKPVAQVLCADGPAVVTVARWVAQLEDPATPGRVARMLGDSCPEWRRTLLPAVEAEWPRPGRARPRAWEHLQMLRCLARSLSWAGARLIPASLLRQAWRAAPS